MEPGREASERARSRTPGALIAIALGVVLLVVGTVGALFGATASRGMPWPFALGLIVLGAVVLALGARVKRRHGREASG